MNEPTCSTCRFFKKQDMAVNGSIGNGNGTCHRNPPTVFPVQTINHITGQPEGLMAQNLWTPVGPEDWCGEHQHAAIFEDAKLVD